MNKSKKPNWQDQIEAAEQFPVSESLENQRVHLAAMLAEAEAAGDHELSAKIHRVLSANLRISQERNEKPGFTLVTHYHLPDGFEISSELMKRTGRLVRTVEDGVTIDVGERQLCCPYDKPDLGARQTLKNQVFATALELGLEAIEQAVGDRLPDLLPIDGL
ncbi:hypothetical protein ACFL51_01355 [Myxococcota bacterium]